MKLKWLLCVVVLVAAFGILCACGGGGGSGGETITIVLSDSGWDSQRLHIELARLVVEHAYDGYKVDTSAASSTLNWQAMIAGDVDMSVESWSENVASFDDDIATGRVVQLGIIVPNGLQGLYVPRYVIEGDSERGIEPMAPDLRSVEDLKNYAHVFPDDEVPAKGRIYGSIPGWMADEILYKKYEFYGLDEMYTYMRLGSESSLFSSLDSAYNLGEAWVGYCYEPTWITGKLDLVLLEDAPYDPAIFQDGLCAFPDQQLKIICGGHFPDKAPELLEFFENYQTGSAMISSALAHLDDTGSTHEDTAIWLLKENDQIIDQWLPTENAAKLRDYLSSL